MKKHFFSLLMMLPVVGFCQVGVGTNNVDPSAKFQIESSNKGFLQPRVALSGTTDVATIASPAAGLMVYNTATAGSGATAITPGVYYFDGTKWERLVNASDNNNNVIPTTYVNGLFLSPNMTRTATVVVVNFNNEPRFVPMKVAKITVPEGKWEIKLTNHSMLLGFGGWQSSSASTVFSMQYWLQSDSSTNIIGRLGKYVSDGTYPAAVDNLFPGSSFLVFNVSNNNLAAATHNGSFFVNNTTGGDRTYYLMAADYTFNGNWATNQTSLPTYDKFGSSDYPYNRFYAVKIN